MVADVNAFIICRVRNTSTNGKTDDIKFCKKDSTAKDGLAFITENSILKKFLIIMSFNPPHQKNFHIASYSSCTFSCKLLSPSLMLAIAYIDAFCVILL